MKSKRWLTVTIALGLFGGLVSLSVLVSKSQQTLIKGRVVSAETKAPISDVMVSVESIISEEKSHGSFVRTDSDGRFVAEVQGDNVIVRAWKPKYLMNGLDIESAISTLSSQPINIELREIEYPNLATVHDDYLRVKSNLGYSLARGELVEQTSPEADITINLNPDDNAKASVVIESLGEGGVIYQAETETLNSVTALEAPAGGYQRQVVKKFLPHSSEGWFLFVRARDGKHYAKLVLGITTILQPDGTFYVSLDQATRFACNYQPDGSRNLGGNPTKNSFPFSEFGFDANSLNR
jgi:hypothetical protein